jgi:D-aminopeptidase
MTPRIPAVVSMILALAVSIPAHAADGQRPRVRDLGLAPGILEPGPLNSITDVAGVAVGHRTLVRGDNVRTGVTAVVPHDGNVFQSKVPAAVFPANAFGKAAGFLQVAELGTLEAPILLTNTLCVGTTVQAVVEWVLRQPGNENVRSVNAVVGETNDGWLNDIRNCAVRAEDVAAAIELARGGAVEEGSVGAGTGTSLFGYKGGIGTASRLLPEDLGGFVVGALVQSNFGGVLVVDGLPVGESLGRVPYQERSAEQGGSCMIVLATDAPVSPRNLERMAKRAALGLARTGSFMSNGSGDFVIAFSTAQRVPHDPGTETRDQTVVGNDAMSPLFLATVEAVEEAVLNSLFRASTVIGVDGHTREAFPIDRLTPLIAAREESAMGSQSDLRIDYIELETNDMETSKAFFCAIFGWETEDWGPDYASFSDGRLSGGFRLVDEVTRGGPLVVVYASDLEAVEAAVIANGGTIVRPIFSFPGGRRFHFLDPVGNELAVWSDS